MNDIRQMVHDNNKSGLPDNLIVAIVVRESNGYTAADSTVTTARGLMQVLRGAQQDVVNTYGTICGLSMSDNVSNPETSIKYGSLYMQILYERHGDSVANALSYYSGHSYPGYAGKVLAGEAALDANGSITVDQLHAIVNGRTGGGAPHSIQAPNDFSVAYSYQYSVPAQDYHSSAEIASQQAVGFHNHDDAINSVILV